MINAKLATFRAVILGLVLMPLINLAPAAMLHQKPILLLVSPFSIQVARIFCISFGLLCWLSIPFINRHVRLRDADKMRNKGFEPDLLMLLLNLGMLLCPVLIVLILSFIGLPLIDIYIYSYPIFIIMIGWLWWKRSIFWSISDISGMPDKQNRSPKCTKSYTRVLVILSILAIAFLFLKIVLIVNPPEGYSEPLTVTLPWALIYALLVAGCMLTTILRLRNSQHAVDLTAVMSIILAYWIPFGTAAYIYWRMKIKAIELAVTDNSH